MSMTPDYFISSCGLPKLNREKYKPTVAEKSPAKSDHHHLKSKCSKEESQIVKSKFTLQINDKKKLLCKRTTYNNHSSSVIMAPVPVPVVIKTGRSIQNQSRCKWGASDKERKCRINQRIKEFDGIQKNSRNNQLDNRLSQKTEIPLRETHKMNQTDKVLPPLET